MLGNTINKLTFDREFRLIEYSNGFGEFLENCDFSQCIGHKLNELIEENYSGLNIVLSNMLDLLEFVSKKNSPSYNECHFNFKNNSYFMSMLASASADRINLDCIVVDEVDVYGRYKNIPDQLLSNVLNNTPIGISVRRYDMQNHCVSFITNMKMQQLFSCDDEELNFSSAWNESDDLEKDSNVIANNGLLSYEKILNKNDGTICKWLSVTKQLVSNISNNNVIVTVYSDFTIQKKSEIKTLNTLKTLNMVVKSTGAIIFSHDIRTGEIDIFGEDEGSSFVRKNYDVSESLDKTHPEDKIEYEKNIKDLYDGKINSFNMEVRQLSKETNDYHYYRISTSMVNNTDGSKQVLGFIQDVNKEKEVQKEREQLSLMNVVMFNNMPVGVEIYDEEGCLTSVNDKELEHFGLTRENVPIGSSLFNHIFLSDKQKEMIRSRKPFSMVLEYDFDKVDKCNFLKSKYRGIRYFDICFTPLINDKGEFFGYMSVNMDTTELHVQKRKLEELSENLNLALEAGAVSAWIYYPKRHWFDTLMGKALAGPGISLKDSQKMIHPDDKQMQVDIFNDMINRNRNHVSTVFRYKNNKGTYNYYESKMLPNVVNGRVESITGTQRDITEKLISEHKFSDLMIELKNSNGILREIVENMPCLLSIKDASEGYRYVIVNNDFCKALNKNRVDIEGHTVSEVFGRGYDCYFSRYDQEAVQKNRTIIVEEELPYDGKKRFWQVIHTPVKMDNGHIFIIEIYTDISKFKKANDDMEKAKARAEEADKLKSAFLANMSHEIRTPLNSIVGFSEMLQYAEDEEEKKQCMQMISRNSEVLLRLINDILDLSKIESGSINIKTAKFDIVPVLNEAMSNAKCSLGSKKIDLLMDNPYKTCVIDFDKQRFMQIVNNYLSNAVKYTVSGYIRLGLRCENDGVKIYVSDTGIGIKEEKQKLLFNRFNKLDDFAQGTGLGLAICKAIAEAVGGKVGFHSEENFGSTFWVWLPCGVNPTSELSTDMAIESECYDEDYDLTQLKQSVLIAEDNDSNFMLLNSMLEGCSIKRAVNGEEALNLMRKNTFCIVLMDLKMSGIGGLEAIRRIRLTDKQTPIIVVTANAFESDRQAAFDAGANAYITKPFKRTELLNEIRKHIKS